MNAIPVLIVLGFIAYLFAPVILPKRFPRYDDYRAEYDPPKWEEYDFEWCVDCLAMDANGTIGDHGDLPEFMSYSYVGAHLYNWPNDDRFNNADTRHAALMNEQWPVEDGWVVSNNCGEECEGHFSSSRCDGCGSTSGGDRHPAHAMRKIETTAKDLVDA